MQEVPHTQNISILDLLKRKCTPLIGTNCSMLDITDVIKCHFFLICYCFYILLWQTTDSQHVGSEMPRKWQKISVSLYTHIKTENGEKRTTSLRITVKSQGPFPLLGRSLSYEGLPNLPLKHLSGQHEFSLCLQEGTQTRFDKLIRFDIELSFTIINNKATKCWFQAFS